MKTILKGHRSTLEALGMACGEFRRIYLQVSQAAIAHELGCTSSNISLFECGKNDSAMILLWYIRHGFNPEEV